MNLPLKLCLVQVWLCQSLIEVDHVLVLMIWMRYFDKIFMTINYFTFDSFRWLTYVLWVLYFHRHIWQFLFQVHQHILFSFDDFLEPRSVKKMNREENFPWIWITLFLIFRRIFFNIFSSVLLNGNFVGTW
jgi:hypothetical protein